MKESLINGIKETFNRWGHNKFTTVLTATVGTALITVSLLGHVIPNDPAIANIPNDIYEGED